MMVLSRYCQEQPSHCALFTSSSRRHLLCSQHLPPLPLLLFLLFLLAMERLGHELHKQTDLSLRKSNVDMVSKEPTAWTKRKEDATDNCVCCCCCCC